MRKVFYPFFILISSFLVATLQYSVAQDTKPYPEVGSPDLGPPCERNNKPYWVQFYCSYMTKDLWQKAGRPSFKPVKGRDSWEPFYYSDLKGKYPRNDGLLEGLKATHASTKTIRYTPWSVYFKEKMGCHGGDEVINPYLFTTDNIPRDKYLAFGWEDARKRKADSTQYFEPGAFFVLFSLANLHTWGLKSWNTEDHLKLAYQGYLKPDYQRDGEVWLVHPNGQKRKLDNLDEAANVLSKVGMLFTNDSLRTWRDGYDDALIFLKSGKKPFVYMYIAQDIFYPWSDNSIFRKRVKYLIDNAVSNCKSDQDYCIRILSHGWSSHIVTSTVMHYANIKHFSHGPAHGEWGNEEYINAIKETVAETRVMVGDHDFVTLLGGGAAREMNLEKEKCF